MLIEGRQKTPESLLRAALGIATGDPVLTFSLAQARARIESIQWVQHASVQRRLPDTILVRLTERRPFAVWQHDGRFVLIDRDGNTVTDSDVAAFANQLPLVVGPGAPAAAAALVDALAAQPGVQARVVAAVRVGERRWNLRIDNGTDVLLPEAAEAPALAKLVQLQAEHALLDRPLQAVDLRLPDRLVVRAAAPDRAVDPLKDLPKSGPHACRAASEADMNDMSRRIPAARRARARGAPGPRPRSRGRSACSTSAPPRSSASSAAPRATAATRVLGFGWQRGRGVRGGGITDIEDAERAIRAAVGQAENEADTRLRSDHREPVLRPAGEPAVQRAMAGGRARREPTPTSAACCWRGARGRTAKGATSSTRCRWRSPPTTRRASSTRAGCTATC